MNSHLGRSLAMVAVAALLISCSPASSGSTADGRLTVVTTTTVIADLVRNVGGDRVDVSALVPPGGEVHTFDPSPSDIGRVDAAGVIFSNGLGLDHWLEELVTDAGAEAPIVALGEDLAGVDYRAGDEEEGGTDPHLWLNVAYAALYVDRIADELSRIDPSGSDVYAANAEAYTDELHGLDEEVRVTFADIPASNRRLVSYHDAFGYFADAYGLEVVGTVTDAPGQDPSAGEIAALIDEIRRLGVRAILAEAQFPTDLADRIAEETGITVVSDLYSDSIGPAPADSFVGLVRSDLERIVAALR
jgi:ABC-type Zn uptake system ZnuABC Zn-binding protein ZnuA